MHYVLLLRESRLLRRVVLSIPVICANYNRVLPASQTSIERTAFSEAIAREHVARAKDTRGDGRAGGRSIAGLGVVYRLGRPNRSRGGGATKTRGLRVRRVPVWSVAVLAGKRRNIYIYIIRKVFPFRLVRFARAVSVLFRSENTRHVARNETSAKTSSCPLCSHTHLPHADNAQRVPCARADVVRRTGRLLRSRPTRIFPRRRLAGRDRGQGPASVRRVRRDGNQNRIRIRLFRFYFPRKTRECARSGDGVVVVIIAHVYI